MQIPGRHKAAAALIAIALLGCSPRPSGYTGAEWDRYRRDHRENAEVLAWVAQDLGRARAREALAKASPVNEAIGDPVKVQLRTDELEVVPMARTCLETGREFGQMAAARLEERLGEDREELGRVRTSVSDHEIAVNRIRFELQRDLRSRSDARVMEAIEANIREHLDKAREGQTRLAELGRAIGRESQGLAMLR
jgi:hypothetical protein